MFHARNNHLVTRLHLRLTEGLGHQIDTFRGTTGKYDFLHFSRMDKLTHFLTGLLMQIGGPLRQEMDTTVHIGIHIIIFVNQRLYHLPRFLCRCPIIEINERFAVNLSRKNREIFPYLIYIVHLII